LTNPTAAAPVVIADCNEESILIPEFKRCATFGNESKNKKSVRMAARCGEIVRKLKAVVKDESSISNTCSINFLHQYMVEKDPNIRSISYFHTCFNFASFCDKNSAPLFPLTYQGILEDIRESMGDGSLQEAFDLAVTSNEYLNYERNVFVLTK